jgi:hypothetical protein
VARKLPGPFGRRLPAVICVERQQTRQSSTLALSAPEAILPVLPGCDRQQEEILRQRKPAASQRREAQPWPPASESGALDRRASHGRTSPHRHSRNVCFCNLPRARERHGSALLETARFALTLESCLSRDVTVPSYRCRTKPPQPALVLYRQGARSRTEKGITVRDPSRVSAFGVAYIFKRPSDPTYFGRLPLSGSCQRIGR